MKQHKRNIAIIFIASILTSISSITSANAADYRYWTFWVTTNDQWSFANEGAGTLIATDQLVTGWKFAVTGVDNGLPPVTSASFAELCPDTSEQAGAVRVAVVVDFNDSTIAPDGEIPPSETKISCISLKEGLTAADALNESGLEIRANAGFVCGINGYPKEECGIEVAAPTEIATTQEVPAVVEETSTSSRNNPAIIGLGVIAIITALVVSRMRKKK